eukprot:Gb_12155 [translate_table: standard]
MWKCKDCSGIEQALGAGLQCIIMLVMLFLELLFKINMVSELMALDPDCRGGETLVWGADNEKEQGHKAYEKLLWGFKTLTEPGKIHHGWAPEDAQSPGVAQSGLCMHKGFTGQEKADRMNSRVNLWRRAATDRAAKAKGVLEGKIIFINVIG